MIRFLYGENLKKCPELKMAMHIDRAQQFKHRLGWDVKVGNDGQERDEYDDLNPIYIIVEGPKGSHAGSMRLLPTTGRTMVNDHFLHLTDGVEIRSPLIWECTRLCLAPDAPRTVAPMLLAAGAKLMQEFEVEHFVGVFDNRMTKIYARFGASPTIVGASSGGEDQIAVGLWEFKAQAYRLLCLRANTTDFAIQSDFDASELGGFMGPHQICPKDPVPTPAIPSHI